MMTMLILFGVLAVISTGRMVSLVVAHMWLWCLEPKERQQMIEKVLNDGFDRALRLDAKALRE